MKGFQSGQEPEVEPPLSDPHWEGSRAEPREAADVLWSHLMVGKANNTLINQWEFCMNGKQETRRTHEGQSCKLHC